MLSLKATSAMWHVARTGPYMVEAGKLLNEYRLSGALHAFKGYNEIACSTSIVITDLTNFFFLHEDTAKRYFKLMHKSPLSLPGSLFHVNRNKDFKINV